MYKKQVSWYGVFVFLCFFQSTKGEPGDFPGKLVFDTVCVYGEYWIQGKADIAFADGDVITEYFIVQKNPGAADYCVPENIFPVGDKIFGYFCGCHGDTTLQPVKITFYVRTCTPTQHSEWSNPASISWDIFFGEDQWAATSCSYDVNCDGIINIADVSMLLSYLFQDQNFCEYDRSLFLLGDINDDNHIDISDATKLLSFLFGDNVSIKSMLN